MRKARWIVRAAVWTFALVPLAAIAAPGDLDRTFGTDGKVTTGFRGGSFANAVAVQEHGRLVVVGAAAGPSDRGEFAVARYRPDGTLDRSFDGDGRLTTPIGAGGGDEATDVAVQPDGRIVVVGTDGRARFAAVRYLRDGSLDPSFGGDGIVRTDIGLKGQGAEGVAIQTDGRIVVVGWAGAKPKFVVVRYRADGRLDSRFGGHDGIVLTGIDWGRALAVALQPDGRIVVSGFCSTGLAIARYLRDGRLDRTFSGNGIVRGPVGSELWQIMGGAVALQHDGKIVVGGDYGIFALGVARILPDGVLDGTWGGDGVVRTRVGGGEQGVSGLVVQPNGWIVATGSAGPHEYGDDVVSRFLAVRYRSNGSLDPTWGGDGKVVTFFPGGARGGSNAVQSNGRIVAVGGLGDGYAQGFALVRYLV